MTNGLIADSWGRLGIYRSCSHLRRHPTGLSVVVGAFLSAARHEYRQNGNAQSNEGHACKHNKSELPVEGQGRDQQGNTWQENKARDMRGAEEKGAGRHG